MTAARPVATAGAGAAARGAGWVVAVGAQETSKSGTTTSAQRMLKFMILSRFAPDVR
jgi:hypothetical protein